MNIPAKKKPPEGGLFVGSKKITSSRVLQGLQGLQVLRGLQEPKRQRPEQEPVLQRGQEPEPVPERVLSCHKRPGQLRQR